MKTLIINLFLVVWAVSASAQDVSGQLAAAKSAYDSENYEDARFALQQALNELDQIIGKEILKLMPTSLGGINANTEADNVTANAGFVGLYVSRTYGDPNSKSIDVSIANNSPMLAMVNIFLNSPLISSMALSGSDQKVIKLHGYKGMLEKTEPRDGVTGYSINVPFGDSLFTFETTGIDKESEATSLANEVPLDRIIKVIQ